jgi:hypothetical protein
LEELKGSLLHDLGVDLVSEGGGMRDTGHEDVLEDGVALLAVDEAGELAEERQRQIDVVHAAGLVQREVQFLGVGADLLR